MLRFLLGSLLAALFLAPAAQAQDEGRYLELLREDIRTGKVAILTEALQLSDEEAEVFWPIHREYQVEWAALGDQEVTLMKRYADTFDAMDDETAKEIVDGFFKLEESRLKVWKNYFKKFSKALSPRRAAQFVQLENQINLLIGVQIASQTPLIH